MAIMVYRRRTGHEGPVPPLGLRARVGTPWLADFVEGGKPTVSALEQALGRVGRRLEDARSILDFGCGSGRVITPLHELTAPGGRLEAVRLTGCDVDEEAVRWLSGTHPRASFVKNPFLPPIREFADGQFDLVYSISIFTHLNENAMRAWLQEIHRLLAPGGVALLTVHSERAFEAFRSGAAVSNSRSCSDRLHARGGLEEEGFVFEPYERSTWNEDQFAGIDGDYGLTFHSRSYITETWSEALEVRDVVATPQIESQDIVVLTKPDAASGHAGEVRTTGVRSPAHPSGAGQGHGVGR
jgi:SAM-dependent methyltransferase